MLSLKNDVKQSCSKTDAANSEKKIGDALYIESEKKTDSRVSKKAYTEQVRQQLHLFNNNPIPNRFLIVSFKDIYMQYLKSEDGDTILIEAVSNKFLPKDMKRSAGQMNALL